jgi:hypothetical protein
VRQQLLPIVVIASFGLCGPSIPGQTQSADPSRSSGPDPREIPVPRIATSLGALSGVTELPTRTALPDVMVMNDGTRVTSRGQWDA